MRAARFCLVVFTLSLVTVSSAQQPADTAIPNLIRYAGTLKNLQGGLSNSNTIGVTFAIYKDQTGGAPIWMETQNVRPNTNGQYSVLLG